MPTLPSDIAGKADDAASGSFEAIPEDTYLCSLRAVEAREGTKAPYWAWEFEVAEGEHKGRRLWNNTSLSDNALWKVKETFEAFGVPTNTDTDDLVGQVARLVVSQRVIEKGARAGQIGNNVDAVLPAVDEESGDEEPF